MFEQFLGLVDRPRRENEKKGRKEEEEQKMEDAAASEAERIRELEHQKRRHRKALVQPELDDLITAFESGDFVAPSPSRITNASRLRVTKRSRKKKHVHTHDTERTGKF